MKLYKKLLIPGICLFLVFLAVIFFYSRSPVIIVSDNNFISLYGEKRLKNQILLSSIVLFRQVKPVNVADNAENEMLIFAITEASKKPFCVLFPLRFWDAARVYMEQFPDIPAVLLRGRNTQTVFSPEPISGNYFFVKTDLFTDFYRAGAFSAILDGDKDHLALVFVEQRFMEISKEAFSESYNKTRGKEKLPSFYVNISHFTRNEDISSALIAGIGAEFLERHRNIPVILFTWANPAFISKDVMIVFDDSPPSIIIPAVQKVKAGDKDAEIPSKILFFPDNIADNAILRLLKKAAKEHI